MYCVSVLRTAGIAIFAVAVALMPMHTAQAADGVLIDNSPLYPRSEQETKMLQGVLFLNGCFGSRINRESEIDGRLGPNTKRAIIAFSEVYARTPGATRLIDARSVLQEAARQVRRPTPLCLDPSPALEARIAMVRNFGDDHDPNQRSAGSSLDLQSALAVLNAGRGGRDPAPDPSPLWPRETEGQQIFLMQGLLFLNQCYGNRIRSSDEVDGKFGPLTKRALAVFVETYNARLPRGARPVNDFSSALTAATSVVRGNPFCANANQLLSTYFGELHDPSLPPGSAGGQSMPQRERYCSWKDVGRSYLESFAQENPAASGVLQPLADVVTRFEAIFPDRSIEFYNGLPPERVKELKEKNIAGFSYQETLEALKRARALYMTLSFHTGMRKNSDCQICYRINEWMFLTSVAQASAGVLSPPPEEIIRATNMPIMRVPARQITLPMMESVLLNVRLYRAYVLRYDQIVERMATETKSPAHANLGRMPEDKYQQEREDLARLAGIPAESLDKERAHMRELDDQRKRALIDRDREWSEIVFIMHREMTKAGAPKEPLMRTLAEQYQCDGFTGASIDAVGEQ